MFRFSEVRLDGRDVSTPASTAPGGLNGGHHTGTAPAIGHTMALSPSGMGASGTPGAMTGLITDQEPITEPSSFDDLPRTLRRVHEERAREAREREAQLQAQNLAQTLPNGFMTATHAAEPGFATASVQAAPVASPEAYGHSFQTGFDDYGAPAASAPYPAVVKAIDVPFFKLVLFCLKLVIAAIPALLLLMAILWGVGQAIETYMPELLKMKILISFPGV